MESWFVYLIRTSSGALYTGVTKDIQRRFAEHSDGGAKAAKALRGKGPLTLEYQVKTRDKSSALKLEIAIKKWPKQKKEALIAGVLALPILLD
ncbi:GIY-YIG nuclease family protein [Microbulbifer variabilis]|uniref:GIY-YIG nuclease family protein n=1 Tax=Microbulbifer variabilis TaxID=266805 RepID=UPI001CFD7B9D|nr:GIY-YIG nuclease family protein [Microbulbifer variabilis]